MKNSAKSSLLLLPLFLCLALAETSWLHGLQALDGRLSDWFVRQQSQKLVADPDIVIVSIDNASLGSMIDVAGNWPWPRSVYGELVRGLAKQHPKAIIFDITFDAPDVYRPESDKVFNEALDEVHNVYYPMERRADLDQEVGIPQISQLAGLLAFTRTPIAEQDVPLAVLPPKALEQRHWKRSGTIKFENDVDGVGRRYTVYSFEHGWLIPSLPARVAKDLGYQVPQVPDMILSWAGKKSFKRISFVDLYRDFEREIPQRPANELTDKIVVIGADASGLNDMRVTPLDSLYPGVGILATAIENLKNKRITHAAPAWFAPILAVTLLVFLCLAFLNSINLIKAGSSLLIVSVLTLIASYLAVAHLILVPVLAPLVFAWIYYLACALQEYRYEKRAREKTVQMFSRFVNPHVVQELVAHGGLRRGGEDREVSVLFSDIRGFTSLCEHRTAQEVVEMLNRYFTLQVEVIFRHGGSLDKFIGDCVMAFWGAPLDDPQHALHAVQAALEMTEVLQRFKQELGENEGNFDIGIGIHSGPAVVGLIGSDQRREYTAIGDTVNLASRIEGLTKGVSRILVSRETMALCGNALDFTSKGSYKVIGREQEVELFAVEGKSS